MCGIIGYVGEKNAAQILVKGLKRLEYRGYDSSGIAVVSEDLRVQKKLGKIAALEETLSYDDYNGYTVGIGHTRWATHGEPSDKNSHPHSCCNGEIAIVHNGIIENFAILKEKLIEYGHDIKSDTDSEVIVHLIEYRLKKDPKKSLLEAVQEAIVQLEGTYGLAVVSSREPGKIICARKGSPLIIGVGNNEMLIASDVSAIAEHTRQVIYIEDDEIIEVKRDEYNSYDLQRNKISKTIEKITWDVGELEKQGYDHYMMKEIYEQVETITNAFRGRLLEDIGDVRLDGLNLDKNELLNIDRIIFIACGTSWHAGLIGEYLIEEYARIPVEVEYASEFRYRRPVLRKNDLIITISQSGETADTLAALREAKAKGIKVLGITNGVGSTIARESDGGSYIHAGAEIGVASTKAFTSQVAVLVLLTILLSRKRDMTVEEGKKYINDLREVPELVKKVLADTSEIERISKIYKDAPNFLYLGRGAQFPVALEGALKLKEISYIHAEGYPAAEMKHGPIALIDENMPVVFIACKDEVYAKVISNMQEVKARGGKIIAIATEGDEEIKQFADHVLYIPDVSRMVSPLLTIIPLQLLSYYIATFRGCDVDQPRNLAKSVTVE